MKKLKVIVYAICKNEEKFVNRWVESMKEADEIYVLDTGSTDNTVSLLENKKVNVVVKEIKPWRFDVARNLSLSLVPTDTDICVCTDLDEVFLPGWRKKLEKIWNQNKINRLFYNYIWALDENDKPLVNFYISKIHSRHDFMWIYPVHEVLKGNNENKIYTDEITLKHYPDRTKSRSSYLPLLELSVKENPKDDRNMHYLGREYMYYGKYNEAIDTLIKHTKMQNATWKDERCASMRFIARCYKFLKRYDEAIYWANKAEVEAPYLRDPYIEKALILYENRSWVKVIKEAKKALKIEKNKKSYINEVFCTNEFIYDLMSICYYNLNEYTIALRYAKKALKYKPNDIRIINNIKIFENLAQTELK